MTAHFKIDGAWTQINRPYIKINGAWVPAKEILVKRSGVWTRGYAYDLVPPPSPTIALANIVSDKGGNWIRLGVSLPAPHRPDVRMIRVLSTYQGKQPTTQYGGTYTAEPDDNFPNEGWSDWKFDGSRDTSVERVKTWPRSAQDRTELAAGTYYFSAWALDDAGNWSVGTHAQINVPKKNIQQPIDIRREGVFSANWMGSWEGGAAGSLDEGFPVARDNPKSRGIFLYGSKLRDAMTGPRNKLEIRQAQIFLSRTNDNGKPVANIFMGWIEKGTTPGFTNPTPNNLTYIGNLGKGQGKWFDIPTTFNDALKDRLGAMVLVGKDPSKSAADANDFSKLQSAAGNRRNGEIKMVWVEKG